MSSQRLVPLTCQTCNAPVPLGAGDDVTCPSCGAHQPLPEPYRVVRDARLLSAEADRELQRLSAEVNQPPPLWKRAMIIVGFVVGGITVIVLALGVGLGALGALGRARAHADAPHLRPAARAVRRAGRRGDARDLRVTAAG